MAETILDILERDRKSRQGITRLVGADALRVISEHSRESAPVLGVDARTGAAVSVDLDAESPHVLLSMASGAGKSATLRLLLAQHLMHGANVLILDYKRHSHRWVRHLPPTVARRVAYCRDVPEIHDALCAIAREGMRRNRLADLMSDEEYARPDAWPRIIVACEELNATMAQLEIYWRESGGRRLSPAILAMRELVAMGRACKINVYAIAQRASAKVVGGGDARESFSTRILARYTMATWRMLCDGVPFLPPSEIPGRMTLVRYGEAIPVQAAYLTDSPSGGETVSVARFSLLQGIVGGEKARP